jgi:hypothetical protein
VFADCGLGKTFVQLVWAENVARKTGGRVLILTPLAVAKQIQREAHRFGYPARVIRDQSEVREGISICNYDRLDKINPETFGAVALDESSILKDLTGATTRAQSPAGVLQPPPSRAPFRRRRRPVARPT